MSLEEAVVKAVETAVRVAACSLPGDVLALLREARERENGIARALLDAVLENAMVAAREQRPLCQDTGLPVVYVELGDAFPLPSGRVEELVREAVLKASEEIPLRPNWYTLDGEPLGYAEPSFRWELCSGCHLDVLVSLRGGGCESVTKVYEQLPTKGLEGVVEAVVEAVKEAGAKPCPPVIVGVGAGGTTLDALAAAYKALTRRLGERNKLEEEILARLNKLGIGPQGLGGATTALDVKVEVMPRHPAFQPVAVVISCWALRRARVRVGCDGKWKLLHPWR